MLLLTTCKLFRSPNRKAFVPLAGEGFASEWSFVSPSVYILTPHQFLISEKWIACESSYFHVRGGALSIEMYIRNTGRSQVLSALSFPSCSEWLSG